MVQSKIRTAIIAFNSMNFMALNFMIQHHFLTGSIFALSILASSTLLTTVSLTSTQIASANNTQTSYPFPGRAEDLAPGSYWYFRDLHAGGTKALDLVGVRFNEGSGKWTNYNKEGVNSSNDSNEDHIIYNTPVHAITDGEVLACWRNAPSNPRPGESHPGRLSQVKTISRAGNFLVVKMANENRTVLYAHLKTGTVPASLCPFNNELMQNADKKGGGDYPLESVIPAAQRPKVKQGQIIGRVGNVGASSGPHLHIDRSDILGTNDEGVSLPINFHGAWVKNITNLQNDATKNWEVLDGKELVTPKTAILPFYSSGRPELNKAAVSADDFQFVFSQAIESGYRPVWIDGYNVNGKTQILHLES
jgi:murein DD-endopeptidase MepM/ murein hydrolase activator NlpD